MSISVTAWKDDAGILHETQREAERADAERPFISALADVDRLLARRCGSELRHELASFLRTDAGGRILRRLHEANVIRNAFWNDGAEGDANPGVTGGRR